MEVILSKHAKEQARERGISINEIKRTIQMGAKHLQGDKIVSDFMHIRVVYRKMLEEMEGQYWIITVMLRK